MNATTAVQVTDQYLSPKASQSSCLRVNTTIEGIYNVSNEHELKGKGQYCSNLQFNHYTVNFSTVELNIRHVIGIEQTHKNKITFSSCSPYL